jgi:hypothetical protein
MGRSPGSYYTRIMLVALGPLNDLGPPETPYFGGGCGVVLGRAFFEPNYFTHSE